MNPNQIFVGKIHRAFFPYLRELFSHVRKKYPKLIVPACGEFTVAELAISAGYDPRFVLCSDISLYSTAIGCYVQGSSFKDFRYTFNVQCDHPAWGGICEMLGGETYEGLFLLMKVCQLDPENTFERMYVEEFVENAELHAKVWGARLARMKEHLPQLTYYNADLRSEFDRYKTNSDAAIFLNPPNIPKGYEKLFAFENIIKWDAPLIAQFNPKTDLKPLYDQFWGMDAFGISYGSKRHDEFVEHFGVAAMEDKDRTYSVVVNRPKEIPPPVRYVKSDRSINIKPLNAKIVDDKTEITEKSEIKLVPAKAENALYYRNLWCHRLGVTKAKTYYMWVINGEIAGVVGFNTADARRLKSEFIYETFGFSAQTDKYPRLNRLLMMCMVSVPTRDLLRATIFKTNNPLINYRGIKTTCITKYRENRANVGVLTMTSSEKQPNDTYMLKYETEWFDRSYSDVLKIWLGESYGHNDAPKQKRQRGSRQPITTEG